MNKWMAVVVLNLMVLTAAMGLKATTTSKIIAAPVPWVSHIIAAPVPW